MKITVFCSMFMFLSVSLYAMENEHLMKKDISENDITPLDQEPENGSVVIVRYNRKYEYAQVKQKLNTGDFSVTVPTQEGKSSHGLIVPLEKLYKAACQEKRNNELDL
jgi:hypothetical protein